MNCYLATTNQNHSRIPKIDQLTLVQIDNNPQKSSVQSRVGKLRCEGSCGTIELSGHSPGKVFEKKHLKQFQ